MEARELTPKEIIPASRKLGRDDAAQLARSVSKLIVTKGKKVTEFKIGEQASDAAIDAMLGPTGNLRAPTMIVGKTLVVGFNEELIEQVLG